MSHVTCYVFSVLFFVTTVIQTFRFYDLKDACLLLRREYNERGVRMDELLKQKHKAERELDVLKTKIEFLLEEE